MLGTRSVWAPCSPPEGLWQIVARPSSSAGHARHSACAHASLHCPSFPQRGQSGMDPSMVTPVLMLGNESQYASASEASKPASCSTTSGVASWLRDSMRTSKAKVQKSGVNGGIMIGGSMVKRTWLGNVSPGAWEDVIVTPQVVVMFPWYDTTSPSSGQ